MTIYTTTITASIATIMVAAIPTTATATIYVHPAHGLFHFKRVMPMPAAPRFGAYRNLFGHASHHHAHHHHHAHYHNGPVRFHHGPTHQVSHDSHDVTGQLISPQIESLRQASSAMSNVVLRNLSSSTAMGEPSQLVDPSEDDFEERHRHYSFITVLAIMSLFILISISIFALILGFCRKNAAVFSLGGSTSASSGRGRGRRCGKNGGQGGKKSQTDNAVSQFELDSLDAELDDDDIETKTCKDDRAGVCYYHLSDDSDDEDDDDDYDDDNHIYDSDEDYFELEDTKNTNNLEKGCSQLEEDKKKKNKNKKQRGKKKVRKSRLRFRDSDYYYHLHNEEEADDSSDDYDYSFHQRLQNDATSLTFPKRSTTFPQLQSVLTSQINGESLSPYRQPQLYNPSPTPTTSSTTTSSTATATTTNGSSSSSTASSLLPLSSTMLQCSATANFDKSPTSPSCSTSTSGQNPSTTLSSPLSFNEINTNKIAKTHAGHQIEITNDPRVQNPETLAQKEHYRNRTTKDALAVTPRPPQILTTKNHTISKLNSKRLAVLTVQHRGRQAALVSSRRKRRLFKSYSLPDILHITTTDNRIRKPVWLPPKRPIKPGQGASSHRVTFKVGTSLGDTDIRLHHV